MGAIAVGKGGEAVFFAENPAEVAGIVVTAFVTDFFYQQVGAFQQHFGPLHSELLQILNGAAMKVPLKENLKITDAEARIGGDRFQGDGFRIMELNVLGSPEYRQRQAIVVVEIIFKLLNP